MRRCTLRLVLLAPLLATLTGCGFELRGSAALPPELDAVHLAMPENHPLARELATLLAASGRRVVPPEQASAQLQFERNALLRDVQSVGATARVREFALRYDVAFRVVAPDGREIQPLKSLEIYRDYTFDQGQVLGAASEEEFLRDEMTREMASRIMRALASG